MVSRGVDPGGDLKQHSPGPRQRTWDQPGVFMSALNTPDPWVPQESEIRKDFPYVKKKGTIDDSGCLQWNEM